jgi:amino-acid N-acetyltransferase|tara:strand:+ start:681 stop:1202 length:522 start_codon:yes stop_codon:yes gene_type:complete
VLKIKDFERKLVVNTECFFSDVTSASMQYLKANDFPALVRLLEASVLPTDDLNPADLAHFLGVYEGDVLLAAGGLQILGNSALLRSVATLSSARHRGLATGIVKELEIHAQRIGIEEIYLLTETAGAFFQDLGYEVESRNGAPSAITKTAQFSELCSQSAALLHKCISPLNDS